MAFEKFITPRRGFSVKYDEPRLKLTKHHIVLNDKAKEQVGEEFNYVVLYFDKEIRSIGLWFWKEKVLDSYSIGGESKKAKHSIIINGKRFYEKFGITKIVEKIGKVSFLFVRDEKEENFYTASLKK